MSGLTFVNLPVRDLEAAVDFYQALGFTNNPKFTDETAACMTWSDTFFVMLLTHDKWKTFTNRPIPPATSSEVLLGLSLDSRAQVDEKMSVASARGGTADVNPVQDHGFMYGRNLADPDGHVWELMWMDPSFMKD